MSETNQPAMIKVLGFEAKYERLPVKGDPLNDNVDDRGFKLDEKGKRVLEVQEVHWVHHAPAHAPLTASTWDRVRHCNPEEVGISPKTKEKHALMQLKWSFIEPAYEAWKKGVELAVSGTPLGAWAGVTSAKAEVLRRHGIRSVEEVAALVETQLEKIQLPGMRALRKEAIAFLDGRGAAEAAARDAARDEEIAALRATINEQNERMSAMMDMLEDQAGKPADELSSLRADLDALGIQYHHKAGVDTLKGLLAKAKAA